MAMNWVADEAALLPQAFDEAKDAQSSATNIYVPSIKLGTAAQFHDAGSTEYGSALFKYVRYTGGASAIPGVAGKAVYYKSADDNYLVTMDVSTANSAAGILHATCGGVLNDDDYVWIQLTGIAAFTDLVNIYNDATTVAFDRLVTPVTAVTSAEDGQLEQRLAAAAATVLRRPVAEVMSANAFLYLDFPR